jgi:hypothetical protein
MQCGRNHTLLKLQCLKVYNVLPNLVLSARDKSQAGGETVRSTPAGLRRNEEKLFLTDVLHHPSDTLSDSFIISYCE